MTLLALAVDTVLVARAVLTGFALLLGTGSAAAAPSVLAVLVLAFRAVLRRRLVLDSTPTNRAHDGRKADTQGASSKGLSGLVFGQCNGNSVKTIGIHFAPSLCSIAQRQSSTANTAQMMRRNVLIR